MKSKHILAFALLFLGLPAFSYKSTFEEVLGQTSNQTWTVTESQVLKYTDEEDLARWNSTGNIQQSSKLTIKGNPKESYGTIYFKPCQDLVMKKVEGEDDKYTDNFLMKGMVTGQNGTESKPQTLDINNVSFVNFLTAITNKGAKVTLSSTNFTKNKSETDGGALYNESGTLTVNKGSNLKYNLAKGCGGAIYNKGNLIIQNSTIGGQHNEGIYRIMADSPDINTTSSVDLSEDNPNYFNVLPDSEVTYKVDKYLGDDDWIIIYYVVPEWKDIRAINWPEESEAGTFNSYWVHIYPLGNEANKGAGIYNEGDAEITSTTFRYNIAKKDAENKGGYGGGIYNSGNLTVKSSNFYYNKADKGGGIYTAGDENTKTIIEKTTFTSNKANYGAGAYIEKGQVTFKNDTFGTYGQNPSNQASCGGGIYNENGNVSVLSSTFTNNKADKGGDIYNKGTISISKTSFGSIPQTQYLFFGIQPVYTIASGKTYTEDSITYIVNPIIHDPIEYKPIKYIVASSALQGGAIYNEGTISEIVSSTFNQTTAIEGGAIYNEGTIKYIKSTKFDKNVAENSDAENEYEALGGSIYNKGIIEKIEKATFSENSSTDKGGAIYGLSGEITVISSEFKGNYSKAGGAVYIAGGEFNDTKSTYSGNYSELGGAIYNNGTATIENSAFTKNSAYKEVETTDEAGETITEKVLTAGGAIYNDADGNLSLINITFGNKKKKSAYINSANYGSALYNAGTADYNSGNVYYNESVYGALYNSKNLKITRIKFLGNNSDYGGALYNAGTGKAEIYGSTFSSNNAKTGGAIYSEGELVLGNYTYTKGKKTYKYETSFSNNTSSEAGGAVYLSNNTKGNITNVEFKSNKAYSTETTTTVDEETGATVETVTPIGAGGAISIGKKSEPTGEIEHLTISDSTFNSNSAGKQGGAISVDADSAIDITNSQFSNNTAYEKIITKTTKKLPTKKSSIKRKTTTTTSTATTYQGSGGAVYINGNSDVSVSNSTFTKNKAVNGGALYISGYVKPTANSGASGENSGGEQNNETAENSEPEPNKTTVTGSTFKSNIAGTGGAVYNEGYLDINGSTFEYNAAASGGAICNDITANLKVDNTTFESNSSTNGGAIFNIGTAEIINSFFYNEKKYVSTSGGAVYNIYKMTLTGNEFSKNIAVQGGAVFNTAIQQTSYSVEGDIVSKNNKYIENKANVGGAIYNESKFSSEGDLFKKNTASYGGVILNRNTLKVVSSTFEGNTAGLGGAVYNVYTMESTENSVYKSNSATYGGAIYNQYKLTLSGGEFTENTASLGGAIYSVATTDSDKKVTYAIINIDGVLFNKNVGSVYAGALYLAGNYTKIENSIFKENSAELYGGAILVGDSGDTLTINSTTFEGNYIGSSGGAIFNAGSIEMNIVPEPETPSGTGEENTGSEQGGDDNQGENPSGDSPEGNDTEGEQGGDVQQEEEEPSVSYTHVIFNKNKADNGGAIYNASTGVIKADKLKFEENSVTCHGGAVYNEGYMELSDASFVSNKAYSKNIDNKGGAIYNNPIYPVKTLEDGTTVPDTSVTRGLKIADSGFGGNYADYGGAIYNTGNLDISNSVFGGSATDVDPETGENIDIEFEGNTANKSGGAIFNKGIMNTKDTGYCKNSANYGAGIYNEYHLVVGENVSGEVVVEYDIDKQTNVFKDNVAISSGGAIYSASTDATTAYLLVNGGMFYENTAHKNGGAVYNDSTAYFLNTTFYKNTADGDGGAIYSDAKSKNVYIAGAKLFYNTSGGNGGAIYTGERSKLTISSVDFQGNSAAGNGGALYVEKYSNVTMTDVNFINNTAGSKGGAIYAEDTSRVYIYATNEDVEFSGNTANGKSNAIYLNNAYLFLTAATNRKITINDDVDGKGTIIARGDVYFGNYAELKASSDIILSGGQGIITISNENNFNGLSLSVSGETTVNIANGKINTLSLKTLALADNTVNNVTIDVDLKRAVSDKISAKTVEGNGKINVSSINLTSNSKTPVTVNLSEESLVDAVSAQKAETAEATYKLKTTLDSNGNLMATAYSQRAKASVLAAPVAAQLGGYLTQINSYDQAFMNMDTNMTKTLEERTAEMGCKFACSESNLIAAAGSSYAYDNGVSTNGRGLWTRPYATFERVNLSNGPKVGNIGYGNFFGGDCDMKQLRNGWSRQFSAYIGYNGSNQDFDRQSIDQNGGTIGITEVWYKKNFFTGLTANVSANAVNASTDIGHENFPMLMAGIASKTGYNFEFKGGKFIIQPSLLLSYSFVHTFSHNNGRGMHVGSSPLNAIQVAPGIKFIANLPKGWQPYMAINMRWNIMDKTHFSLQDVSIPDMSVDPYVEYGIGVQRKWGERFTGYGQAMIRNGGRNGVMLSFGFKWALGK